MTSSASSPELGPAERVASLCFPFSLSHYICLENGESWSWGPLSKFNPIDLLY